MIRNYLNRAKLGQVVYIHEVTAYFESLTRTNRQPVRGVLTLISGEQRLFPFHLPALDGLDAEELEFLKTYFFAKVYNILSALGGKCFDFFVDQDDRGLVDFLSGLNAAFGITRKRKDRNGYGRCINVIDRMMDALCPGAPAFGFHKHYIGNVSNISMLTYKNTMNI